MCVVSNLKDTNSPLLPVFCRFQSAGGRGTRTAACASFTSSKYCAAILLSSEYRIPSLLVNGYDQLQHIQKDLSQLYVFAYPG